MLRGNFPAKIDAQGRIKIPTAHRKLLADQFGPDFYVTSITGDNVLIYPMQEWEKIEAKMLEPPKMVPAKVKFLRNTSYYGQVASMDKQGRVLIQPHLRDAAAVNGEEVDVMGQLNHLVVWNRERFQQVMEEDRFTPAELIELGI